MPLRQVAREVIAGLVLAAEAKGNDLGKELDAQEASVQGTNLLLHTLIRNAVENVMKYSLGGSMVTVCVISRGKRSGPERGR